MSGTAEAPARLHRMVAADGVALVWRDYGPAAGRAVLLCHGLAAGGDQFEADARFFAGEGFRVLVPDLRGHGRSGKARAGDPEGYAVARMAGDLIAILDAAGVEAVDYVGNSLGGILAFSLLERHGHRFRSLATFGTAPALDVPIAAVGLIPLAYRVMGREVTARLSAAAATRNVAARACVAALLRDFDPEVGRAVAAAVCRYDFAAQLFGFPGPVLIIRGGRDVAVNRVLDRYLPHLRAQPKITVAEIAEAGHCANLDAPEAVHRALLAFWAAP